MNGHRIFPSKNIRYLGIYLDEALNGGFHCKILSQKLKRANGMLCRARHFVMAAEIKSLYCALFSAHFAYGCQIWGQRSNTHNFKISKLQNRAMRIISSSDLQAKCDHINTKLNIIKIENQNCLLTHDTLNKTNPACF